ncbi:hypothetical protein AB0K14_25605 [Actinosynnema sp. NPDC050801]|uniref:hypothetical protein n=1 Tax=unclassified Actinosynnema TaxID=2637065 RepID=UPI0033CFF650
MNATSVPHGRLTIAVDTEPGYGSAPDLWPSVGEYPVYDPMLYHSMTNDVHRDHAYRQALRPAVAGRRVLDIGTGQDLNWALVAARSGAAHVVAVEAMERSHRAAELRLAGLPEADTVDLVPGLSFDFTPRRRAEVCVSELIGSIASAEGALAVMADARARLLTPDAVVVPVACDTVVGGVSLRSLFPRGVAFARDALPYLLQVFELNGGPFDIRLAVANPPPDSVVTDAAPVERLPLDGSAPLDDTTTARLTVQRAGEIDGLLCWIRLNTGGGAPIVDSLRQRTSWIPAYLPLFDTAVEVRPGDSLDIVFQRRTSDDGVHPDYLVHADLTTTTGHVTGSCRSMHHSGPLGERAVHRELFGLR